MRKHVNATQFQIHKEQNIIILHKYLENESITNLSRTEPTTINPSANIHYRTIKQNQLQHRSKHHSHAEVFIIIACHLRIEGW